MITTVTDKEREQAATIERLTTELESRLDNDLDKILAMSDEQITALTRLDGSNPDDVAALARKAMQCAVLTVERDELRADLDAERDAAELKSACITGMRQEITAWSITAENLAAELERERIRLAACGVVALSDTPDSAAKARQMLPEYESASCDDVKRRVDECMSLRAERDGLKVKLAAAEEKLTALEAIADSDDGAGGEGMKLFLENRSMKAELAALRTQEPVARFNWHLGKFEWLTKYNFAAHNMKPLFLAAPESTFNGKSAEYWNKLAVERWQENQKLEAKLSVAETSANELRRAVAELIGADPETWPNHGNAPLAIAACVALRQAELTAFEAKLEALKAQEPVVIRIRKHYPSGPADGNRRIGDWTYIDQGSVQYAKEQIAGADAIEKLYAAAGAAMKEANHD